jgi:hypothetical protein
MRTTLATIALALFTPAALATQVAFQVRQAPTLSEIGLGTMIVVVAAVAGWVLRKRK